MMDVFSLGGSISLCVLIKAFRDRMKKSSVLETLFGKAMTNLIPEKPWLYLFDGKETFMLEVEMRCSTTAYLYEEVARSYGPEVDARQHLRLLFIDKELKFSTKRHISDYDVINHSTICVVFRLPDSVTDVACDLKPDTPPTGRLIWTPVPQSEVTEESDEENRPTLQPLNGVIQLTNFLPDFFDFELRPDLYRAIMPCSLHFPHVIGSHTMRQHVAHTLNRGAVDVLCPYRVMPFPMMSPACEAKWDYRLIRHIACFTQDEQRDNETLMTINFLARDGNVLKCPGCYTWCSRLDPLVSRLRCFVCSTRKGKEFIFCGYCFEEWKSAPGGSCGNTDCNSAEKKLEVLRNSPVTSLYGGTWPTIRACPRCGLLTHFAGQCSQMHCPGCGIFYCFLCLKTSKTKTELKCEPYNSDCRRAPLQTTIPVWDGRH